MQRQVNDLEYQSRWLSLQVHGISFVKGENLMTSLNRAADKLEIPELTKADIASMHRSQLSNAEYHERLPEMCGLKTRNHSQTAAIEFTFRKT